MKELNRSEINVVNGGVLNWIGAGAGIVFVLEKMSQTFAGLKGGVDTSNSFSCVNNVMGPALGVVMYCMSAGLVGYGAGSLVDKMFGALFGKKSSNKQKDL